jgi:hemerythrin superfamily protein
MDVIQMLKKDHKMVRQLFQDFEELSGQRGAQKKPALVEQISQALTVHAQVEEELVYPAFQEVRTLKDLLCEAKEEHLVAKQLLADLEQLQPDDEQYDAKVKVLCEYVMHHVKEEEKEIFPQAQKKLSSTHLSTLGEEVQERRSHLMGEGDEMDGTKDGDIEAAALKDDRSENENAMNAHKGKSERGRRQAA